MFLFFDWEVFGILASWSGIEPISPALESKVLTTRPPGKSYDGRFQYISGSVLETQKVKIKRINHGFMDMSFCPSFRISHSYFDII